MKAVNQKDAIDRMLPEGTVPTPSTPEEYATYMKSELQKWGDAGKPADIKPGYGAPGSFACKILCNAPLEGRMEKFD